MRLLHCLSKSELVSSMISSLWTSGFPSIKWNWKRRHGLYVLAPKRVQFNSISKGLQSHWASLVAQTVKNLSATWETRV